jgi:O-antigen ligase
MYSPATQMTAVSSGRHIRAPALLLGVLMACSSLVFIEPAPYDLLIIAMLPILLVRGLRIPRAVHMGAILLGLFLLGNTIAAMAAPAPLETIRSLSIRVYMVLAWLLLLSLIVLDPARMLRALWTGYLVAAVVAVVWGILEYFGLISGELWQAGMRARGPFKDPNVFGPFLVPATVYALNRLARDGVRAVFPFGLLLPLLALGILMSFSRGAWLNLLISASLFAGLHFAFTTNLRARLQWILTGVATIAVLAAIVTTAINIEPIGQRFFQRAVLTQKYDTAVGGRFDSQRAALVRISQDPVGVGPGRSDEEFGLEPHNLYLHVFVEGGWIGGLAFFMFVLLTGFMLLGIIRERWPLQNEVWVVFASLTGVLFQSLFIDSTHWRHLWLLFALAWALVILSNRSQKSAAGTSVMSK